MTEKKVFKRGGLVERLRDRVGVDRLDGREEFIELINGGQLEPMGVTVGLSSVSKEMDKFEEVVTVLDGGDEGVMLESLQKMYERFRPGRGGRGEVGYEGGLVEYARELGIEVGSGDGALSEALNCHGSAVYFPTGVSIGGGQLVFEKIRYFSPEIERKILHASEWNLATEKEQRMVENSLLVSIGLSVGSELGIAALQKGVTSFVLADPGLLHADLWGRLGVAFERSWLGVNKAVFMYHEIIRRFPNATIQLFAEGITEENASAVMNPKLLSEEMIQQGGRMLVAEEADSWLAKWLPRKVLHEDIGTQAPWHLTTMGDVGKRVVMVNENIKSRPFNGYMEWFGDQYGVDLTRERGDLAGLFAVVGGCESLPMTLLELLRDGKIGGDMSAQISRVPQSREATLLAGAMFAAVLRILGNGGGVNSFVSMDVDKGVDANYMEDDSVEIREIEEQLRRQMNAGLFGRESLLE